MRPAALEELLLIVEGMRRRVAREADAGDVPRSWVEHLDRLADELRAELRHPTGPRVGAKERP
jgi:hypothetical protein